MSGSLFSSLIVLVMLLNFYCIGTSRIRALIQGVSFQGVLLGIMPLLVHEHISFMAVLMSIFTVAIKGDGRAAYAPVVQVIDLCNRLAVDMALVTSRIGT